MIIVHLGVFSAVLISIGVLYLNRDSIAQWVGDVCYQTLVIDHD